MQYYCEKWVRIKKQPVGLLTEDEARRKYAGRQAFCEVTGDQQEEFVVQFADRWLTVLFLDTEKRPYLEYSFNERSPGRLFLTMATSREYVLDTDTVEIAYIFAYREDGTVTMECRKPLTNEIEERSLSTDVSPNWDTYPDFGNTHALRKAERVEPPS